MATCSNGHENPDTDRFCGICGEPVLPDTVFCPAGHIVLTSQRFCPECGAPVADERSSAPSSSADVSRGGTSTEPWYRRKTAVKPVAIGVVVLLLAGVVAALVFWAGDGNGGDNQAGPAAGITTAPPKTTPPPTASSKAAIREWWSQVGDDIDAWNEAATRTREAVDRDDFAGIKAGCQQLHDIATGDVQAHLPSPDPALTAAVQQFIDDVNTATHLCMSWQEYPAPGQAYEFRSYMDQARAHYDTAQAIVDAASK